MIIWRNIKMNSAKLRANIVYLAKYKNELRQIVLKYSIFGEVQRK
jgi:hypothetical protein